MTTAITSITPNICRYYHQQIFLLGKDSVTGLHNRPSPIWDFCLRSSSPMKRPLVAMASLTCIIVICWVNTDNPYVMKHLIRSGSASMCGQGLLATTHLDQFCFHNAWTEKHIWPSCCKTHCLHCQRMCLGNMTDIVSAARWAPTHLRYTLMFADTSTSSSPELDRTWRPCCIACSITGLQPSGFLLVRASEMHCVWWASFWCSDASTGCPCSLWCYSDKAWNVQMSEAIHDSTFARMHCIPWRPLQTSVLIRMGFRPCTVCARALSLMLFCSDIYRGNYALPDTWWYECLRFISSQESPPEVCRWT